MNQWIRFENVKRVPKVISRHSVRVPKKTRCEQHTKKGSRRSKSPHKVKQVLLTMTSPKKRSTSAATANLTIYTSLECREESRRLKGFLRRGGFPFTEKNVSARPGMSPSSSLRKSAEEEKEKAGKSKQLALHCRACIIWHSTTLNTHALSSHSFFNRIQCGIAQTIRRQRSYNSSGSLRRRKLDCTSQQ
jgi:hypothetical protein